MLVDMVLGLIVVLFASVLSVTASEWQVVSKSTIDIKPGAGVVEATHQGVRTHYFYTFISIIIMTATMYII